MAAKYVGQAIIVNKHDSASVLKQLRSITWWEVREKKANSCHTNGWRNLVSAKQNTLLGIKSLSYKETVK